MSGRQEFHQIVSSILGKLSQKMSLLVILQILELFFNTCTAEEKYSLAKDENLPVPVETDLSKKVKAFSKFFVAFLKSALNFEHFSKEDEKKLENVSLSHIAKLRTVV